MIDLDRELEIFKEEAPSYPWHWASTFEGGAEHSYINKRKSVTAEQYERAFRVVMAFGEPKKFYRRVNIELSLPDVMINFGKPGHEVPVTGVKFWPMTDRIGESFILNMAPLEYTYGIQDAPRTVTNCKTEYDALAPYYVDARLQYEDPTQWHGFVWKALVGDTYVESLLDLGAGIGSALDAKLIRQDSEAYHAVDSSQGMLNILAYRHGWVRKLHPTSIDNYFKTDAQRQFHSVVALSGSASYMTPSDLEQATLRARHTSIFMHYRDSQKLPNGVHLPPFAHDSAQAAARLPRAQVSQVGNYQITVVPGVRQ